jgi:hypothetical protein
VNLPFTTRRSPPPRSTGRALALGSPRRSTLELPGPADQRLAWFVREAWPSPATGTSATEGDLTAGQRLSLTVASDELVLFGDGVESDAVTLAWGQTAQVSVAARTLSLLR